MPHYLTYFLLLLLLCFYFCNSPQLLAIICCVPHFCPAYPSCHAIFSSLYSHTALHLTPLPAQLPHFINLSFIVLSRFRLLYTITFVKFNLKSRTPAYCACYLYSSLLLLLFAMPNIKCAYKTLNIAALSTLCPMWMTAFVGSRSGRRHCVP